MSELSEALVVNPPKPVEREQIRSWVENPSFDSAVGIYGGSYETFNQIVTTGSIPPFPPGDSQSVSQKILSAEGKPFYYFLPFINRLKSASPELHKEFLSYGPTDSEEIVRLHAVRYAADKAIRDYFRNTLKLDRYAEVEDILFLGYQIDFEGTYKLAIPLQEESLVFDADDLDYIKLEADPEIIEKLQSNFDRKTLLKALQDSLRRRGVLFYFNKGILLDSARPGDEEKTELLVTAETPLSAELITGIEPLSKVERSLISGHYR